MFAQRTAIKRFRFWSDRGSELLGFFFYYYFITKQKKETVTLGHVVVIEYFVRSQ